MTLTRTLCLCAIAATVLSASTVHAQELPGDATRGRLLYENHCQGCHTSQAHVRANRKAESFSDVRGWVTRWQGVESLGWTPADIRDVATWLYLRFYDPDRPRDGNSASG